MAADAVQPAAFSRRSFVYRALLAAGARFAAHGNSAIALDYGDPAGELAAARRLGLADLSPLPRIGFKGTGCADWLAQQGVAVPPESNRALIQDGGALAVRLAPAEVLILSAVTDDDLPQRLATAWGKSPVARRGYPVPRADSHGWFMVTGSSADAMFAKLCGVDLRPARFPPGHVAQTSIARLNGIIVRDDRFGVLGYHLLADSASAEYLWTCLMDAMAEFGGTLIGLQALRSLAAASAAG